MEIIHYLNTKEHTLTGHGQLGGIFDPPIEYLFDSANSIDKIGTWQKFDQRYSSLSMSRTSSGDLLFKNTTRDTSYCYSQARNKTPIKIKSYNYVYIQCVKSVFSTSADQKGVPNRVAIYANPDMSNDSYTDKYYGSPTDAGFYNGTLVSGTRKDFTGTQENFLIELNISAYTSPSNTFRIMFTLAPSNSFMQISKIYLSKYKLT